VVLVTVVTGSELGFLLQHHGTVIEAVLAAVDDTAVGGAAGMALAHPWIYTGGAMTRPSTFIAIH